MSDQMLSAEMRAVVKRRVEVEALLHDRITKSITSVASDGRTVDRPESAARYATNALLHHDPQLLAEVAVTFARAEVERLLAEDRGDER